MHFDCLNRAIKQFSETGKVLPQITVLKEGEVCDVKRTNTKVETALSIIEREVEPDAVNFVAMTWVQPESLAERAVETAPKRVLFAMTFDHTGGRELSFFDVAKEEEGAVVKDAFQFGRPTAKVTLKTTDDGDLEIRIR